MAGLQHVELVDALTGFIDGIGVERAVAVDAQFTEDGGAGGDVDVGKPHRVCQEVIGARQVQLVEQLDLLVFVFRIGWLRGIGVLGLQHLGLQVVGYGERQRCVASAGGR